MLKKRRVDVVEADLVVKSGGDQGEHEGQEVDEDGDASGPEGQHPLDLDPFELGEVVPKRTEQFGGWHSTVVAFALRTQLARIRFTPFLNFFQINLMLQ